MLEFLQSKDGIYLIAQAIGVIAALFGIFSFQQKGRGKILVFQIINNILWTLHMFLLGAWAGAALNAIGIFRGIVFFFREDKKWAQSNVWYAVFALLFGSAAVLSWIGGDGALALLPLSGMLFTTVSLAERDPFRVRVISFFSSPCWLTYNVFKGSVPGVCTECFLMCSIIVGILRHDRARFQKKME